MVNDLVIGISARELVAALEKRALSEAQAALGNYVAEKGRLPNPAPPNGTNCASLVVSVESTARCASDEATPACSGRLPEDALSEDLSAPVALWFTQNGWGRAMIYAINDDAAGCAVPLSLDGAPRRYVLIAPGAARGGQIRPSASLSNYLEDAGNADAWSGNPGFATPGAASNDQLRAE
jgi:hypothetical protein